MPLSNNNPSARALSERTDCSCKIFLIKILNIKKQLFDFVKNYQFKAVKKPFAFVVCSPLSESARTVGAGPAVPAAQSGQLPVAEAFKLAVTGFKVHTGIFSVLGPERIK